MAAPDRTFVWKGEIVTVSQEFLDWYNNFLPGGWFTEYTGDIYAMWMAWQAGREDYHNEASA